MPVFEIETPDGKRFQIEAPDARAAAEAVSMVQGGDRTDRFADNPAFDAGGPPSDALQARARQARFQSAEGPSGSAMVARPPPPGTVSRSPVADLVGTGVGEFVEGVPIVGPSIRRGLDKVGAVARALSRGTPYADELEFIQRRSGELEQEHPILSTGANIAGAVAGLGPVAATRVGASALGLTGRNLATRMGKGAVSGALINAADAEARDGSAGHGAIAGAVTGLAGPAIGRAVGGIFGRSAERAAVPSTQEVRQASRAAFTHARRSGVVLRPQAANWLATRVIGRARAEGYDPQIHPALQGVLNRAASLMDTTPSLNELHQLRRVAQSAGRANTTNPDQGRIAGLLVDEIDNFIDQLARNPRAAVVAQSGNVDEGTASLEEGIRLWSQMRRAEVVDEIFERAMDKVGANYTAAGMQTALRQEFRAIRSNPRRFRVFSPEEQEMIKRVVRGGFTENILRHFGKFAPRGLVGMTLSGGAGYSIGGPLGAAATMGGGELSSRLSTAITRRHAEDVGLLARSGGLYRPGAVDPLRERMATALAQSALVPTLPRLAAREQLPAKP